MKPCLLSVAAAHARYVRQTAEVEKAAYEKAMEDSVAESKAPDPVRCV